MRAYENMKSDLVAKLVLYANIFHSDFNRIDVDFYPK